MMKRAAINTAKATAAVTYGASTCGLFAWAKKRSDEHEKAVIQEYKNAGEAVPDKQFTLIGAYGLWERPRRETTSTNEKEPVNSQSNRS